MRTEGQTGTMKPIDAFSDFAKAPNIDSAIVNQQWYALRPHCCDSHFTVHNDRDVTNTKFLCTYMFCKDFEKHAFLPIKHIVICN